MGVDEPATRAELLEIVRKMAVSARPLRTARRMNFVKIPADLILAAQDVIARELALIDRIAAAQTQTEDETIS